VGAGITGTFVVNGSPTKTQMVDSAGGRNQLAQLTAGALVIVVLLFLTVPLSYMPNAVLASVVFLIGIELIDYKGMSRIYRLRPGEFAVAAITAFVVVAVGVMQGILLAIILSVIEHLYHSYAPKDSLFAEGETGRVKPTPVADGAQLAPGLAAYYFGANLYYANVARFTEEVMGVVERSQPPLRWFAIIAATIGDIDFSGADALRQIQAEMSTKGVTLVLVDVEPSVRTELDAYGLTPLLGAGNFYGSTEELLAAYAALPPLAAPASAATPAAPAPGVA
jgi:SulP family sulfate permease